MHQRFLSHQAHLLLPARMPYYGTRKCPQLRRKQSTFGIFFTRRDCLIVLSIQVAFAPTEEAIVEIGFKNKKSVERETGEALNTLSIAFPNDALRERFKRFPGVGSQQRQKTQREFPRKSHQITSCLLLFVFFLFLIIYMGRHFSCAWLACSFSKNAISVFFFFFCLQTLVEELEGVECSRPKKMRRISQKRRCISRDEQFPP